MELAGPRPRPAALAPGHNNPRPAPRRRNEHAYQLVPVEQSDGECWGRIIWERRGTAECWVLARWGPYHAVVPAVRVTRWTDPDRLYVLADNTLWRADYPPEIAVTAEVVPLAQ